VSAPTRIWLAQWADGKMHYQWATSPNDFESWEQSEDGEPPRGVLVEYVHGEDARRLAQKLVDEASDYRKLAELRLMALEKAEERAELAEARLREKHDYSPGPRDCRVCGGSGFRFEGGGDCPYCRGTGRE